MNKYICLLVLLLSVGFLLGAFYVCGPLYKYYNNELQNSKSSYKGHLQASDITHSSEKENNTKNLELERKALKIKQMEKNTIIWDALYKFCIVAAIILPFAVICYHVLREYARYPNLDPCVPLCPFLRVFSFCFRTIPESPSDSQIARRLGVAPDRAAPISVVHRRTRDRQVDPVQEASVDLPGVPSTSNS